MQDLFALLYSLMFTQRNKKTEITLSDRTCVITGVGWGTGNAIVQKFAASGYKVAMLARREDRLAKLENDSKNANAYPCDVTNTGVLKETLENHWCSTRFYFYSLLNNRFY